MTRQILGPKDMPYAIRNLLQTQQEIITRNMGTEPDWSWQDIVADVGLVWCTREVVLQAAEAASDMPLNLSTYARMGQVMDDLGGDWGLLVMFPAHTLPEVIAQCPPVDRHKFPKEQAEETIPCDIRGFMCRWTEVRENAVMLDISPVTELNGLVVLTDLFPGADDEMAEDAEWSESLSDQVGYTVPPGEGMIALSSPLSAEHLGRLAQAMLLLMDEPGVVSTDHVTAGKRDVVVTASGERKLPEIRRITLRPMRHVNATRDDRTGRVYTHRWVVRGHWRNQWLPSTKKNEARWIAPYLKGPAGAPLLTSPKVYVWNK